MKQNGTKFCRDQKIEFKKSFELDRHHLLQVKIKVGINYIHFLSSKTLNKSPHSNLFYRAIEAFLRRH
jgi:hypothetical protein